MKSVYITGMEAISALGSTVESHLNHLKNEKGNIQISPDFNSHQLPIGAIELSNEQLHSRLKKDTSKLHRTSLLASLCLENLIEKYALNENEISNAAFINASTTGGIVENEMLFECLKNEDYAKNHPFIESFSIAGTTQEIAKYIGFKKHIDTISTACSSSLNAIIYGTQLIESGAFDLVVVGGVDSLTQYSLRGFDALHLCSEKLCKPFDEDRDGINIGEGCAYLILESANTKRNALAKISGYGNCNDGYHNTSISEDAIGPKKAVQRALKKASISSEEINYVNAHGTGTMNNDSAELNLMQSILPHSKFSSTKAYTGHTLGASGAIETVFSILSLQEQFVWKSLNFENNHSFKSSNIYLKSEPANIQTVMNNSFGFGGNCSSLILTQP